MVRDSRRLLFHSTVRAWLALALRGGKTRLGGGHFFFDVGPYRRLVVFDGEQIIGAMFHDQLATRFGLGMQGIEGDIATGQVQLTEELLRDRDFIGLL